MLPNSKDNFLILAFLHVAVLFSIISILFSFTMYAVVHLRILIILIKPKREKPVEIEGEK